MEEGDIKHLKMYLHSLDAASKCIYEEKLLLIENEDPYSLGKGSWSTDTEKFASLTYIDILNFLVFSTNAYKLDELRSYKSLDAYKHFVRGCVRDVWIHPYSHVCLHMAKVVSSQRVTEATLFPWAIIQPGGKVLAAHCSCKTGLVEACTHIVAMLFSIEAAVNVRETKTATGSKGYWLPASVKGVECAKVEDIDFFSAKTKKKRLDTESSDSVVIKRRTLRCRSVKEPSKDEVYEFLHKISQIGVQSVILSVKQPFQEQFVPKTAKKQFPKVLSELLNRDLIGASYSEIIKYGEKLNLQVTKEEAESVENETKLHEESDLWNRFKSGRITASHMYGVCHTSPTAPSESLIRVICHPHEMKFTLPATSWRCTHQKNAQDAYGKAVRSMHDNFIVDDAGLNINPDYPVFIASPDAYVCCDCCGSGIVEIKCPCTTDTSSGLESCLEETSFGKALKRNHPYNFQVQTQIHICGKDYADVVVWTEKDIHIVRVEPDADLWEEISEKATRFHATAVMPELIGKFYSLQCLPTPSVSSV